MLEPAAKILAPPDQIVVACPIPDYRLRLAAVDQAFIRGLTLGHYQGVLAHAVGDDVVYGYTWAAARDD